MAEYDDALKASADRAAMRRKDRHKNKGDRHNAMWRRRSRGRTAPFCGVDGEGAGQDRYGRQQFRLLRAGEFELFNDNKRLTTVECLEFLLSLPADRIYVGFWFGYDATMILRDLSITAMQRLFDDEKKGYTYWEDYGIDYRPRQYFRVCRIDEKRRPIVGSSRTIEETAGFFQKSFLAVVRDYRIEIVLTPPEEEIVMRGKAQRSGFTRINRTIRKYCATECELLARVMTVFRDNCIDADIVPQAWRGAGWLSAALHRKNDTPRRPAEKRSPELNSIASRAYYGGRFEVTAIGRYAEPVTESDINSAYPAAMLELPCPLHTQWRQVSSLAEAAVADWYVVDVEFNHARKLPLYSLPHRSKGRLKWPRSGRGVYWSPELIAGLSLGLEITGFRSGFAGLRCCGCDPFGWVRELYDLRSRLGRRTRGYPLKIGLAGAYGKLAQRVGTAAYRDLIAAGLITSITRARLIRAIAHDPDSILMVATDAIYSRKPLPLETGPRLGQWEEISHPGGIFIVQPGVYWPADMTARRGDWKAKTRGIPMGALLERAEEFESAWRTFITDTWQLAGEGEDLAFLCGPPVISVPIEIFTGMRLGLHNHNYLSIGRWSQTVKQIRFEWFHKRRFDHWIARDGWIETLPYEGRGEAVSDVYSHDGSEMTDQRSLLDDAAPDWPSWSAVDAALSEFGGSE